MKKQLGLLTLFLIPFLTSCSFHSMKSLENNSGSNRTGDVVVIAHRGASGYLPEHTLEAVAMAHAFNPDYIEPDLVITRDNRVIVLHDIHLENNTNVEKLYPKRKRADGRWYAVDFSLKEIKRLSVHERTSNGKVVFDKRFPLGKGDFKVPTLSEYIEVVQGLNRSRKKNIGLYPEIKAPAFHKKEGKDALGLSMKILKRYGYDKLGASIFLQCFDPDLLKEFKRRYPSSSIPLIQLIADDSWKESRHSYSKMRTKEGLKEISRYASGIGPWIPFVLNSTLIKDAHELGLKVHVFTLRQKTKFNELKLMGVDGVFTDFPDL